uniref:G_PROTEIN_RECEP_F1_2 domain-containing protein n=1 Tax=Parastrongyloides trichosuri TaxID=131310 RepID=A0A0N4Z0G4_PARTI
MKSKVRKDTFRVVVTSSVTSIFSLLLYSLCSYLWWYSYLTDTGIPLYISNTVCQVRFFGQNLIFVIPFILSVWRYNIIITKINFNFLFYIILFIVSMCPTLYSFLDSVVISNKVEVNDIFTYSIPYTSPFISFLYFITQIFCPVVSILLSLLILAKIRNHIKQTQRATGADNHMKYLTYSLIINSIMPFIGGSPNFVLYTMFSFDQQIPRICWNISESIILTIGGITPALMIAFLPSFKVQILHFLCCKKNHVQTITTIGQTIATVQRKKK